MKLRITSALFIIQLGVIFNIHAQYESENSYTFFKFQKYNFPYQNIYEITGDAISENKFIVALCYEETINNQTKYKQAIIIGKISDNSEISYIKALEFSKKYFGDMSICILNDSTFLFSYRYGSPSSGTLVIGKISKNDLVVLGPEITISNNPVQNMSLTKLTSTKLLLSFEDYTYITIGTVRIVNLLDNAINLGEKIPFWPISSNVTDICIDTMSQSKFAITFSSDQGYGNLRVGTISNFDEITFSKNIVYDSSTFFANSGNTLFKSIVSLNESDIIITNAQMESPRNCNTLNYKIQGDSLLLGSMKRLSQNTHFINSTKLHSNIFSVGVSNEYYNDKLYLINNNFPDFTLEDSLDYYGAVLAKTIRLNSSTLLLLTFTFGQVIGVTNNSTEVNTYYTNNDQAGICVFPNPANGIINIRTNSQTVQKIEILDTQGKVIYSSDENLGRIDLSYFSKGLYFIRVIDKTGINSIKKVMLF